MALKIFIILSYLRINTIFINFLNNLIINFKDCKFKFLFYEDLKNNPKVFVNDFSNFFNVDSDYTYSLFDFKKK